MLLAPLFLTDVMFVKASAFLVLRCTEIKLRLYFKEPTFLVEMPGW